MLTVGLGATTMIGAQQSNEMSIHLQASAPAVATDYINAEEKSFLGYTYTEIDPAKQQEVLEDKNHEDHSTILTSYNHGSRQALRLTAIIPGLMGVGFLALLLYYRSQGGYKVITLGDDSSDSSAEETASYPGADASAEVAEEEAPSDESKSEAEEGGEE